MDPLAKRKYLNENRQHILDELAYHRMHNENFRQPKLVLWIFDNESGSLSIKDVD